MICALQESRSHKVGFGAPAQVPPHEAAQGYHVKQRTRPSIVLPVSQGASVVVLLVARRACDVLPLAATVSISRHNIKELSGAVWGTFKVRCGNSQWTGYGKVWQVSMDWIMSGTITPPQLAWQAAPHSS